MLPASWLFQISLVALLIMFSAFFSGSETALMAVNRIRIRYRSKKERHARLLLNILEEPDKLIGTLLLCNNLVNVALSAIGTGLAIRFWGEQGIAYATVVITLVLLIFAEITPKTLAAYHSERIALAVSPLIEVCIRLFYPVVKVLNVLIGAMIHVFGLEGSVGKERITEEEIQSLIEAGGDEGALDRDKQEMLLGVMSLETTTVGDIMIPLRDVISLPANATYEQVFQLIKKSQVSRYPVYESSPNDLIGFVHVRDFLLCSRDHRFSVQKILRKPHFVPEICSIRQQLLNFQSERAHLSIVVNEYGEIKGIVTLEDIIEEIVGEIRDEHDSLGKRVTRLPDGSYLIRGNVLIRDLNRWLRLDLPEAGVRTIGGFVLKELERIPVRDDMVEVGRYKLKVVDLRGKTIQTVRLWVSEEEEISDGSR